MYIYLTMGKTSAYRNSKMSSLLVGKWNLSVIQVFSPVLCIGYMQSNMLLTATRRKSSQFTNHLSVQRYLLKLFKKDISNRVHWDQKEPDVVFHDGGAHEMRGS